MKDEEIKEMLKNAVNTEIASQKVLKEILKRRNKKLRISYKKLRKLCLESGIRIKTETKHAPPRDTCPCCGSKLRKFYTKSLKGELILTKVKCDVCGFVGTNGRFGVRRYVFLPER